MFYGFVPNLRGTASEPFSYGCDLVNGMQMCVGTRKISVLHDPDAIWSLGLQIVMSSFPLILFVSLLRLTK